MTCVRFAVNTKKDDLHFTFSLWMQMKLIVNVYLITRISSPSSTMTPLEEGLVSCSGNPSCASISAVSCSVVAAVSCTNVFERAIILQFRGSFIPITISKSAVSNTTFCTFPWLVVHPAVSSLALA